ncbi:hypothetical protein [Burkholderia cepacia]|uniref:hypothetical protein n=1 Tax=Burkholderia cepacia TaxID=292 RepID=UPI000ABC0DCD|nr:hypothetical protein [Burkholderia cepacia]
MAKPLCSLSEHNWPRVSGRSPCGSDYGGFNPLGFARQVGEQEIAATGIGRHPNDRSVSFYFRNPSRWFIEYGWDLRTVDPQNVTEESYVLRPGIGWGHDGLRNLEDAAHVHH